MEMVNELTKIVAELLNSTEFTSKAEAFAADEKAALDLLVAQTTETLLLDHDSLLNSLFNLLQSTKSLESMQLLADNISASQALFIRKIQIMSCFYGLSTSDAARCILYTAMVKLCKDIDELGYIQPQISHLDDILDECSNDPAKLQPIYLSLHKVYSLKDQKESLKYLLKYLASFNQQPHMNDLVLSKLGLLACTLAISTPSFLNFKELLELSIIKEMEPTSKLVKVVRILQSDTLATYMRFIKSNPDVFEGDAGILQFILETARISDSKMRVFTFAQFANVYIGCYLSYSQIALQLDIHIDDVEMWVMHAVFANVAHVKINQIEQIVLVKWVLLREFGRSDWVDLEVKCESLAASLKNNESK